MSLDQSYIHIGTKRLDEIFELRTTAMNNYKEGEGCLIADTEDKFMFRKGDRIVYETTFDKAELFIYEYTQDYVTIAIRKKYISAALMQFMDTNCDAVYIGPMIDWIDSVHLTFKRKDR